MTTEQLIARMKEYKTANPRAKTVDCIVPLIGSISPAEIREAAIIFHCQNYGCKKVPADTLNHIEVALGLTEPIKKESVPFDPNW